MKQLTVEQVICIQRIMNMEPISLATPVGDDGETEMGDFVVSTEPPLEDIVIKKDISRYLDKYSNLLEPRGSLCIKKYYGLEDGIPKTLEQIGREYGVTRERIRQIISKGIRKLKIILQRSGVTADSF